MPKSTYSPLRTKLTPSGRLVIRGKNLVIPCYTTLELCIRGQIESIMLEEGNK